MTIVASDLPRMNSPGQQAQLPLWAKVLYTAFTAVLVPYYWSAYGPTNFLYFCDVALLMGVAAMWLESPLLASMPTVGIFLPQMVWCVDFLGGLVGWPPLGLTAYMFNPNLTLFTRGLSLFHMWLPFVLLWMVWRLGYDRRAFVGWTALAWALLAICYFLLPEPPAPPETPNLPVNVNYVHGLSGEHPQTWLHPWLWLACLFVGLPLLVFLPTHLVLNRYLRRPA